MIKAKVEPPTDIHDFSNQTHRIALNFFTTPNQMLNDSFRQQDIAFHRDEFSVRFAPDCHLHLICDQ